MEHTQDAWVLQRTPSLSNDVPSLASLRFRARTRGLRETTQVLSRLIEKHLSTFSPDERRAFAALLAVDDLDILAWVTDAPDAPPVPNHLTTMVALMRQEIGKS